MDDENDKTIDLSPEDSEAVALAKRVVALLDSKAIYNSIDPVELEADEYDGSVSVAEWLGSKRVRQ